MSKCTVLAHVRKPDGSIVESKLFKDLLHYTANRQEAKEHYAVATNQDFINQVRDRLQFDENGEVTLESYKDIIGLEEGENVLQTLNSDIKSGVYDYGTAIHKVQDFNRTNPFRGSYMATLTYSDGQYRLSVVRRSNKQESRLESIIHKQSLQDRILYYLERAGVSVDFLDRESKDNTSRYSTMNAERTAEGLYQLIRIAHGENVTQELAEEAGHFAVGALGDHVLVTRLLNLLTEDVQKSILGDSDKVLGNNSKREVAGMLVGQALQGKIDDKMAWQKLAQRIATFCKKVFYNLKGDDIKLSILNAESTARQIAEGFVSPNFNGNVETALQTKEMLYSAAPSYNVATYRRTIQQLNLLVRQLGNIAQDSFSDEVMQALLEAEVGRGLLTNKVGIVADNISLEGIAIALSNMADMVGPGKTVDNLLKSIDFTNLTEFNDHLAENGRKLRQARTFISNLLILTNLINDALDTTTGQAKIIGDVEHIVINDNGTLKQVNLKDLLTQVKQSLQGTAMSLEGELKTKEFQFFSRFMQQVYGEKYITLSARQVFKKQNGHLVFKPMAEAMQTISTKDFIDSSLESLESDISLYQRWLSSMSNNGDVIGQLVDKIVKQANKQADDITLNVFDSLRILKERLHNLGYKDTSFLFEKDHEGKLTGNILSELNWGEWENDRKAFLDAEREAFKQANPSLVNMSENEKALKWQIWLHPKMKAWNEAHSVYGEAQGRWIPSNNYHNDEFDATVNTPELKAWYNDMMALKESLDGMIPEGSTLPVRMPQFKGTFVQQLRNRRLYEGGIKAFVHTLRNSILEKFCESSEDTEYGSLQTYNSEDESLFYNAIAFETEKMNRLPLFGINKLKDTAELSTDLFHTMLSYAGMASSYLAMSRLTDTLEVGSEVLNRRRVGGTTLESDKKADKSRAYNRYLKYLEKQVYGVSMKRHSFNMFKRTWVLEKIVNSTTELSAFMFLAGNVLGGTVNTGTGVIEMLKEAGSGEYYTLKDWNRALKDYFGNLVTNFGSNLPDFGSREADSKLALLVRRWNILGDNRKGFKDYETTHSWLYNALGKTLYLPYKSGDHFMQCMSYLALARHIKLYDSDGKQVDLIDTFKLVDNKDVISGAKKGKTLQIDGPYYKTKDGQHTYNLISGILNKLSSPIPNLTQEEQDYLNSSNLSLQDPNLSRKLQEEQQKLVWSVDDESSFMDKAREINNRMHGIYNNQDKVAFSQNWFGNALLAMKGWALGMMERRFGREHYSVALGHNVEGSLNTFLKVMRNTIGSKEDFMTTIRAILLPMGKKQWERMERLGYSYNQYSNIKRNYFDFMTILILAIIRGLTAAPDDDDDDESIPVGLAYYFANRLYREQAALNTPRGWYWESNTLLDLAPVGFSAVKALWDLGYEGVGALVTDEDSEFYYQSNGGNYSKGDSKVGRHYQKFIPYYKSINPILHPYQASQSYEYGRQVKQR